MKDVVQGALDVLKVGQPCVIATVVRTKGSTPQKAGAMLLVRDDGSGLGTLGGGCVEGDIWFAAKEILRRNGGPEFKDYYLNEDIAARTVWCAAARCTSTWSRSGTGTNFFR